MTVEELAKKTGLATVTLPEPEREISGAYIGDLLSWVMGRAPADCAWVTVMSNVNVIAVASLADVGCVILAENAELDDAALEKAKAVGINVYRTKMPIFETCARLAN